MLTLAIIAFLFFGVWFILSIFLFIKFWQFIIEIPVILKNINNSIKSKVSETEISEIESTKKTYEKEYLELLKLNEKTKSEYNSLFDEYNKIIDEYNELIDENELKDKFDLSKNNNKSEILVR